MELAFFTLTVFSIIAMTTDWSQLSALFPHFLRGVR